MNKDVSNIKYFLCPKCKAVPEKDDKHCVSCGLEFYKNDSPRFFGLGNYDLSKPINKDSVSDPQTNSNDEHDSTDWS